MRAVVEVDDRQLPDVVRLGRISIHVVQPPVGAQEGAIRPVPHVVSAARQDDRLHQRSLQRLVDVVFVWRRPLERSGVRLSQIAPKRDGLLTLPDGQYRLDKPVDSDGLVERWSLLPVR